MLSVIEAADIWPAAPVDAVCRASAPIASVAMTGSIFFSTSSPMPVVVAALLATARLTSLVPRMWPRIALPSVTVSADPNSDRLSR